MFILEAPYPALASTILLPNPKIGNNYGLSAQVTIVKMMDGSSRTYITDGNNERLHRWDMIVSHDKMNEVTDFLNRYSAATMRATWRDRVIIGKAVLNPVEVTGDGRAGGWPGNEAYAITIEMREQ